MSTYSVSDEDFFSDSRKLLELAISEALTSLSIKPLSISEYVNTRALRDDIIRKEFNLRRNTESIHSIAVDLSARRNLSLNTILNILYHK